MKYKQSLCFSGEGDEGHWCILLALLAPWSFVLDCLLLTQYHFLPSMLFLHCRSWQPGTCLSQNSCHQSFSLGSDLSWDFKNRQETEAILLILWQQWADTWNSAEKRFLQWFLVIFFRIICTDVEQYNHAQCFSRAS